MNNSIGDSKHNGHNKIEDVGWEQDRMEIL